ADVGELDACAQLDASLARPGGGLDRVRERARRRLGLTRRAQRDPELAEELVAPRVVRREERRRTSEEIHSRRRVAALERADTGGPEARAGLVGEPRRSRVALTELATEPVGLLEVVAEE